MSVQLFNYDYTQTSTVYGRGVSSAASGYPVTNLYDNVRRSKVWRSSGYWWTAGETFRFAEDPSTGGTGEEITFVLAPEYSTTADFATALKNSLDFYSTGGYTYTVTYSSTTRKFTISAASSKKFKFLFSTCPLWAGSLGLSEADTNYSTSITSTYATIHSYEYIRWDLGTPINPKGFMAIGVYGTALKLSSNATIVLQACTATNFTTPNYEVTLEYGETGIGITSSTGIADQAYRHWRLKIIDRQNLNGYIELSNVILGDYIVFERGAVQYPLSIDNEDISEIVTANSGQTHVNRRNTVMSTTLEWNGLTVADKEELDDVWQENGTSTPFFVSLDPDVVFSSDVKKQYHYVKITGGYTASLIMPKNWEASFTIREEI